ncbi:MAG: ATP-binding protein [Archaeoglobaceae archaeon]|nr:ATP-binding protein [Archaeoglobaceae archaeon]MDW8127976.1 ATP-binding protein [Archaeoglobaceae archaeon]
MLLVVRIADNGVGIPGEIKSKIFESGYSRRGGGLGLFLVKKIVEMFKGRVIVKDNVPRGAIFEIRLPLKSEIQAKE